MIGLAVYTYKGYVWMTDGAYWSAGVSRGMTRSWHRTISREQYHPGWKEFEVTFQSEECPEYSFAEYKMLENHLTYEVDYDRNCYYPRPDVFIQIFPLSSSGIGTYLWESVNTRQL